jgi:uncharacterized membrane protein YhaH (DUF805 family)
MDWMLMPYRRYAEFSGRSRRMEYWMFALFQIIVTAVLYGILIAGRPEMDQATGQILAAPGALFYVAMVLLLLFFLATIIPALAVGVRRLHDTDRSGWWLLIEFIPFGGLVLLVFMCLDGTHGSNRFGPDPKGADAEVFA